MSGERPTSRRLRLVAALVATTIALAGATACGSDASDDG